MKISNSEIKLLIEKIAKEYTDEFYKSNPDILDVDDPLSRHVNIKTTINFSKKFKDSLDFWINKELNVLKSDLIKKYPIQKAIKELTGHSRIKKISGINTSIENVLSPYSEKYNENYKSSLNDSVRHAYILLLKSIIGNLAKEKYTGFEQIVNQIDNIINSYTGLFSMVQIEKQINDTLKSASKRGFFGTVSSWFENEDKLIYAARQKILNPLASAIAYYFLRHRIGKTKRLEDDDKDAILSPGKSRFSSAETLVAVLKRTLAKDSAAAALATAQARKDYFRRVMKKRESEGKKGSLADWFPVHYAYAYANPGSTLGYWEGQLKFLTGTSKISSDGSLSKSRAEIATIAYPKSHKNLNDSIGKDMGRRKSGFPKMTFILDGKITAIYSQDVYSDTFADSGLGGFRSEHTGDEMSFSRYAGGKVGQYRKSIDKRSGTMIYDLENYEKEILKKGGFPGRSGYNEAFLDNWKIKGIAADWQGMMQNANKIFLNKAKKTEKEKLKQLYRSLQKFHKEIIKRNIEVYDNNFKQLSPDILGNIFDQIFLAASASKGIKIKSFGRITSKNKDIKPASKEIYFYGMYKDKEGNSINLTSFGDKKITAKKAIRFFNTLNKYVDDQKNPTRPRFFYGTKKSKKGNIVWKKFTPRIIQKQVLKEYYENLLIFNKILL